MSVQQNPSEECSVLHGLAMFSGQLIPKIDSNQNHQSNEQLSSANHTSKTTQSGAETIKLVGSNRFVCRFYRIFIKFYVFLF